MSFEYILLIEQTENMDSFHSTKIIKNKKTKQKASYQISSLPVDFCFLPHTSIFSKLFLNPLSPLCAISMHMSVR